MKSGLSILKDGFKDLVESINALPLNEVLVGIPEDKTPRKEDTINNAALGYIHENGAPEANIPARPFLVPGVIENEKKITSYFKQAGQYALKADKEGIKRALNAAGMTTANKVKEVIQGSEFPPLAEATIAARLRRGRTGVKPLIDTGQLRNSITYVVVDGSKDKK